MLRAPSLIAVVFALAAAGSAAAKVRGDEVTLSAILSETGPYAATGARLSAAYRFAVDRVNAAGGVEIGSRRYDLVLEVFDAGSTAPGARAAVDAALAGGGQFLLGDAAPSSAAAAAAAAAARGRAFIAPIGRPVSA
ncbi:MAG: ABC transporter substrate-binding protein, partial [Pseudomonadota bacterium]